MKTGTAVIILSIILVVLLVSLPAGPLWLTQYTLPIRQGVNSMVGNAAEYFSWMGDVKALQSERDDLIRERNELRARVVELENVERENESLRSQLDLSKNESQKLLLAKTFGLIDRGGSKYLLIDGGSEDGVKQGQAVVAEGALVGRINEVGEKVSIVELSQTAGSIIPVKIRMKSGVVKAMVKANYNLTARLEQVLQSDSLEEGSVIVTSGEGGTYPANIVVGTVGRITASEQQPFKSAEVELPWDVTELETVFVRR